MCSIWHELFHYKSLHRYLQYAWIHLLLFLYWHTIKFQFWHEYVSLLRTKLFKNLTLVLKWILEFWSWLDMVANFTYAIRVQWVISMSLVRFVLGDISAEIFKLTRVLKQFIAKTDYSIRPLISKKHIV